jgi:hypothetical protein
MRQISVILLTITSVLMMLACVSKQAPTTAGPKVGKPLVKRLPANVEGVELVGGGVRAKSGYHFVKQPNGTVTVARMSGLGIGGTWSCDCSDAGDCGAVVTNGFLYCTQGKCTGACTQTITVGEVRTKVIAY